MFLVHMQFTHVTYRLRVAGACSKVNALLDTITLTIDDKSLAYLA